MRYSIIANPKAGIRTIDQKCSRLAGPARILDAGIHGLDTGSAEELGRCACELATRGDVVVVAGGDGTFSDIVNSLDTSETVVAYLPLGTGNALKSALGYRGDPVAIARRIRSGPVRAFDLVDCDGRRKAFMASLGFEGAAVRLWNRYRGRGDKALVAYMKGVVKAYFHAYHPAPARITIDGKTVDVDSLFSLMVVKQPFYGLGMRVVPRARWDDRRIHLLWLRSGLATPAAVLLSSLTVGNRWGKYATGQKATVGSAKPMSLQIDGDTGWEADRFGFRVLPGALRIKC